MMALEELYSGIPDDSVNLTFQDLAAVKQSSNSPEKKKSIANNMETIQEAESTKPSSFKKLPSLDFNRGFQETKNHRHHDVGSMHISSHGHHHGYAYADHPSHHHGHAEFSRGYDDDMSIMSMNSMYQDRGGRTRRPGIPHSNICTVCSTYIYIFRHRCLVCGRVYCRNCVSIGMGEMTEGRKCIQCLGRRFSQR
ncbi:uncharacterized protein LOC110010168 [Jatropha curcas]|uniref:uncharacterized protein LOC110010168 n=1 Tax=Jatropha curcas TaxID=180498 RepID=UPI001894C0C0|nr:uncharacterized protein LOC110010168 [Jatropha curcas]